MPLDSEVITIVRNDIERKAMKLCFYFSPGYIRAPPPPAPPMEKFFQLDFRCSFSSHQFPNTDNVLNYFQSISVCLKK